jgi:hypothetical protein
MYLFLEATHFGGGELELGDGVASFVAFSSRIFLSSAETIGSLAASM